MTEKLSINTLQQCMSAKKENTENFQVWAAETILLSLLVFEVYFSYISYQQRATRLLSLTVIDAVNNFSVIHSRKRNKKFSLH